MKFPAPKIAFLDLEGTLLKKNLRFDDGRVAPSFWTVLAAKLGSRALAEENASKDKWLNGGYRGYVEWVEDSLRFLRRHGLTELIFNEAIEQVKIADGIGKLFAYFKKHSTRTCIITGGFKELTEKVTSIFPVDHVIAACECQFRNGILEGAISFPSDYFGKVDFMRIIMREHQLSPYEAIFVGDGENDVSLARNVAISISFNGQRKLEAACTAAVKQRAGRESLEGVVRLLQQPTRTMLLSEMAGTSPAMTKKHQHSTTLMCPCSP